jgi:hypothetical protein
MTDGLRWLAGIGLALQVACGTAASGGSTAVPTDVAAGATDASADAPDGDAVSGPVDPADASGSDATVPDVPPRPAQCSDGEPIRAWQSAPQGTYRRGELAADFSVDLLDGTTFTLSEAFSGCDSYAFVVDTIPVSDQDNTSIWGKTKDIVALLKKSPPNVHWFFVSRMPSDKQAEASLTLMQERLIEAVGQLPPEQNEYWWPRLHVVAKRANSLGGWLGQVFKSHGVIGFGIDRTQRIRGFGMLADVTRFKSALQAAQKWPWEANLAYAAHEPLWWNMLAKQELRRAAGGGKRIDLWQGEVISEFAEVTVTLDSVGDLSQYDTLEVDIDMQCPDPDKAEPGNCGAWDYIASLSVYPKAGAADPNARIEILRAITTYHREAHWTVDATPLLAELAGGGKRRVRWEWAPPWNVQPTATRLSLRFLNKAKGLRPVSTQLLWTGGGFNSQYDAQHPDRTVTIPQGAKKVELWTIITGHGSAQGTQCAEFCNHEHRFSIGSQSWVKDHPAAQNQQGCMAEIGNGMTPNQGGTWWFGRGGWCPGQQVDPWVADITAAAPPGSTQTIRYQGTLQGKTPPDGDANVHASVYLVVYQ